MNAPLNPTQVRTFAPPVWNNSVLLRGSSLCVYSVYTYIRIYLLRCLRVGFKGAVQKGLTALSWDGPKIFKKPVKVPQT